MLTKKTWNVHDNFSSGMIPQSSIAVFGKDIITVRRWCSLDKYHHSQVSKSVRVFGITVFSVLAQ
jgi:hypothetical protein